MEQLQDYLPQNLAGKNVLVTGGSTGIGRAIVVLLAKIGANVAFFGHEQQHVDDALAVAQKVAQGKVHGFTADITKEQEVTRIFNEVDQKLGSLHILINNAAIGYHNVTDGSFADWQKVLNVNLLGYFACTAHALERMVPKADGHIINIGSMSAQVREATGSVYVATKAGIEAYSEALRKDINSKGIKVTLIEPGAVDTDMQEKPTAEKLKMVEDGEMLTADDIAIAVLYALSQPKRCDVVELKIRPHLQII
jgi:NADP-dependent 3-hydroxy acid dehydrogenase YdfG